MSQRGRKVAIALGLLIALLFLGRWGAIFLAEQWWAAEISTAATIVVTRWMLLRASLDMIGIATASVWFGANLLFALRIAKASSQPVLAQGLTNQTEPPSVAPGTLRAWAIGLSVSLGVLLGSGTSEWADEVSLAGAHLHWSVVDPTRGLDLAVFVAQLPLWLLLQSRILGLLLVALVAIGVLYLLTGAIRFGGRYVLVHPPVRLHLAVLLAGLALAIGWGFLLEPYELASGVRHAGGMAHLYLQTITAELLAGTGCAVAAMTIWWGVRGKLWLVAAPWLLLGLGSLVGELLAPAGAANRTDGLPVDTVHRFEVLGFGLALDSSTVPTPTIAPSFGPSLWRSDILAQATAASMGRGAAAAVPVADRVMLPLGATTRPVWLVLRVEPKTQATLLAVADDRVTANGGPISYREGDTLSYPGFATFRDFSPHIIRPGAAAFDLAPEALGIPAGGWLHRLALAWALQIGQVLTADSTAHLAWRLQPVQRLRALVPFADWGVARPRLVDGELLWIADGYVTSEYFPVSRTVPWRGREISFFHAAFVGVVSAETGKVNVYLRPASDPIARAWASLGAPLIQPASAIPARLEIALSYPPELFSVQSRVMERGSWRTGIVEATSPTGNPGDSVSGDLPTRVYHLEGSRQASALLQGQLRGHQLRLRLVRLDSTARVETAEALAPRWERFPFFQQLRDSVQALGGRVIRGPVRHLAGSAGIVAYQPTFAIDSAGRGAVLLVSLALGPRLGTGRSYEAAWQNLRGEIASFPSPVGPAAMLQDAREWMLRADSALRRGDMPAFGRAFQS